MKVIIEAPYLSEDEIRKACEMCIKARASFIKTSTGWVPNGSTLEMVRFITSFVGGAIKVKAPAPSVTWTRLCACAAWAWPGSAST